MIIHSLIFTRLQDFLQAYEFLSVQNFIMLSKPGSILLLLTIASFASASPIPEEAAALDKRISGTKYIFSL